MQAGETGWDMLVCCMGEVDASNELEQVELVSWLLGRGCIAGQGPVVREALGAVVRGQAGTGYSSDAWVVGLVQQGQAAYAPCAWEGNRGA